MSSTVAIDLRWVPVSRPRAKKRSPRLRATRVISDTLDPSEEVLAYVEGLVKVKLQLFERCTVVLSDRRLLVFRPRWPFGHKLGDSFDLSESTLINHRRRLDGSTLAIVNQGSRMRCLYFPRSWRHQADEILASMKPGGPGGANTPSLLDPPPFFLDPPTI